MTQRLRPTAHLLLLAGLFGCTGKLDVSLPGPVTEGRIDPVTVSSSLTKVKGLLTGYPPTDAEIRTVYNATARYQAGQIRTLETLNFGSSGSAQADAAVFAQRLRGGTSFQQAAQADPSLPEIHLALAQIYFESGKQAEALREAEQELAIVPESRAAQSLRLKLGGAR